MNGIGKYRRALHYVTSLEEKAHIDIKEFKQIQDLKEKLKHTGYKLRSLETTRVFFFIILYSSFVSAFTYLIPGLGLITGNIIKFGSIIGSTISLIIVGITSKAISTYILDLNIITSHLVSILSRNIHDYKPVEKKKRWKSVIRRSKLRKKKKQRR